MKVVKDSRIIGLLRFGFVKNLFDERTLAGWAQSGFEGEGAVATALRITLLAGELAARLAREELAARGSLELARQQAQLNRLVIEEMVDGVLVIDRRARVRAANPAARRLLAERGLGEADVGRGGGEGRQQSRHRVSAP